MFGLHKSTKKASARQQIAIQGVQDGVLELPGRRYRMILSELRSEEEQDVIIDTYESFLNSISWPIQILVRTRKITMNAYLAELHAQQQAETVLMYQEQLQHYRAFIRSLIANNTIMTRRFYIIIPYQPTEKADDSFIREQLLLRADILAKGMARLGMRAYPLDSLAVLELFYSFYSPIQAKTQPLTEQALRMIHQTLVHKAFYKTGWLAPSTGAAPTKEAYCAATRTRHSLW